MAIWSIPESNTSVNVAPEEPAAPGTPNFLEAERLKLEAEDAADIALKSSSEIVLDGSNKVTIPGYAYTFEALGERILVSLDIPLSGYECKTCLGRKRIKYQCECVTCGRAGSKYSLEQIKDIRRDLGDSVADARVSIVCPARNRRDLEDIPDETRRQLEFIWLEHVEDAVAAGLENTKAPLAYPPPSSPAHLAELIA